MNYILKIPNTVNLICECWIEAELELQKEIERNYPDKDEEFVTELFHGLLSKSLNDASAKRLIESAFLSDLESSYHHLLRDDRNILQKIARGIIADVTLHKRRTEKKTGGDMGLVIIRPNVQERFSVIDISDYRRGILTQAKMKRRNGKWGKFSTRQKELLPKRFKYLALLLYSYKDITRRNLELFRWQVCSEFSFIEIETLLKKDDLEKTIDSTEIIKRLGNAEIGTDNKHILDEEISPAGNPSLVISITWRDGTHPGSQVRIYTESENKQKLLLRY